MMWTRIVDLGITFLNSSAITDKVKQNKNTFTEVSNKTPDRSVRIKRVSNNNGIPKKSTEKKKERTTLF